MARSVMKRNAGALPSVSLQRSSFDLSEGRKMVFDADGIYPCYLAEVIPGDTFNLKMTSFIRLATPLFPVMDNAHVEVFFFYVPNRIIWANWEKLMGERDNPNDSIDYTVPTMESTGDLNVTTWTMGDYYALPYKADVVPSDVSALPARGYNRIYNDWFRDTNLVTQSTAPILTLDTGDHWSNYFIQKRAKRTDYFTSCLPAPQRGESVPVQGFIKHDLPNNSEALGMYSTWQDDYYKLDASAATLRKSATSTTEAYAAYAEMTVAGIREAHVLQKLLETDARTGTRHIDLLKAHYGVTVPDFRLQRSEYLGGGSARVNISPVANTSDTTSRNQGDLAGFGTASNTAGFTKSFVEHGYIHGFINVRADLTYQQGLERHWSRRTRFDFYYPVLANLTEQATLNKEIFYDKTDGLNDEAFGYNPRYEEMRYGLSKITGRFRSQHSLSLDAWHFSENFGGRPTLGSAFIESSATAVIDRAIAVPSEPQFIADLFFDVKAARPMPTFGIPGMRNAL